MTVKVRFAPSPTGYLHLGSARTALFNFLFARSQNGIFLLRIEDTDKERSKKEFEEDIYSNLQWLGISWDDKVIRQSERINLYKEILEKLIDQGLAYYCFCSKEELELRHQEQLTRGEIPKYPGTCRSLTKEEALARKNKQNYVIRLKVPEKSILFKDFLRGEIKADYRQIGDFIIAKKEDEPLYVLANTVDDYYQGITHVIRGEEFISTTPKQLLIYKYLEWPIPIFVHLPLVLGQDRSKLSKRHGAKSIREYREEGYLPEAILNFIVLLGWHPEGNDEIISLSQMINQFKLEKLNKSPSIFNISKLNYFNRYYLRIKNAEDILNVINFDNYGHWHDNYFEANNGLKYSKDKVLKIINLGKERALLISDVLSSVNFFFEEFDYPSNLLIWKNSLPDKIKDNLTLIKDEFTKIDEENFISEKIKLILDNLAPTNKGEFFWPLRVALSGKDASPPPFELAEIFGKKKTLELIDRALEKLGL
ncbi:MAG: glutamate--tRNA ligase [Candidatus Parcubacteria bacterium]|nr:MAG: glutamate--tRNA ligase [Candidatus Parcubacteria bacterium]